MGNEIEGLQFIPDDHCACRSTLKKPYDMNDWTKHELVHHIEKLQEDIEVLGRLLTIRDKPWWRKLFEKLRRES